MALIPPFFLDSVVALGFQGDDGTIRYQATGFLCHARPDMAEGCNEKIDLEFIMWVWNYPKRARTKIYEELEQSTEKEMVVLRTAREMDTFLEA